jgi:hypothetical protein
VTTGEPTGREVCSHAHRNLRLPDEAGPRRGYRVVRFYGQSAHVDQDRPSTYQSGDEFDLHDRETAGTREDLKRRPNGIHSRLDQRNERMISTFSRVHGSVLRSGCAESSSRDRRSRRQTRPLTPSWEALRPAARRARNMASDRRSRSGPRLPWPEPPRSVYEEEGTVDPVAVAVSWWTRSTLSSRRSLPRRPALSGGHSTSDLRVRSVGDVKLTLVDLDDR